MNSIDIFKVINKDFIHSVKDPLWQNIPLSKGLKKITETKVMEKLSRIKQTGVAHRIYPGAVHTRLSHSLGVYFLARKMIESLAKSSATLPFSEKGILSFLASCLLHDIGHFPYAHSLKEISPREHEEIASYLIYNDEELKNVIYSSGADPYITAAIIDKTAQTKDRETLIYRSFLSGPLDPDKLDYLSRDAFFAGIPYGKQDTDFIIANILFNENSLLLDKASISSLEQLLFSKYMMYKNLYWHKGVRSATAMIKKAIISAEKDGEISFDDLYLKDDWEFISLIEKKKDGPLALAMQAERGELFERKASCPFNLNNEYINEIKSVNDRCKGEDEIYSLLKNKYPRLKSFECIIDIPEPINFETDISVMDEGVIRPLNDEDLVFKKDPSLFLANLRQVSLFLPSYVDEKDAKEVFEKYNG